MSELISVSLMESLAALDESAMPSSCSILRRTFTPTPSGGSTPGAETAINTDPIPCRVTTASSGGRSAIRGETIVSVESVVIALALTEIQRQNIEIDDADVIAVTGAARLPGDDLPVADRYQVAAKPSVGSYSTSLLVPVEKVS